MFITDKDGHARFGKFIRNAREEMELAQWELAEILGVSQSFISYLERGERDIDLMFAIEVCMTLNADMRKFLNQYYYIEEVEAVEETGEIEEA
jgi:transcriptional regulator with XRE-family HTH domain